MKSIYHFLLIGTVLISLQSCQENLAPTQIETHLTANPLDLPMYDLSFDWEIRSSKDTLAAYQILVASNAKVLSAEIGDLWDSGKRYAQVQQNIKYHGKTIAPGSTIWYKIRVWDMAGKGGNYTSAKKLQIPKASAPSNRLVFLGGTLMSRMEKFGHFETALTSRWPQHNITFRNLGWPGDDVFGTARSQFGSAQNTKSWQPPTAEKGFGFETLRKQVSEAAPGVIMIAYGAEAVNFKEETDFERFEKGYEALLSFLDSTGTKMILLSPHRHEKFGSQSPEPTDKNKRLERATQIIRQLAEEKNYPFVNLYEKLILPSSETKLTDNGMHLTNEGYQRLSQILLAEFELSNDTGFKVHLNQKGVLSESTNCTISDYEETGRGPRFNLKPDMLPVSAAISATGSYLLKIDGEIHDQMTGESSIRGLGDSLQYEELRQVIIEKNRLHRYRINPLNSAYIFLFRQHEMGHLAYEMQDFDRLVEEQEHVIANLRQPKTSLYEIELASAWAAPREYPDHEVPKTIPAPDIEAELNAFTHDEAFQINLFAADPMIANPINLSWDTRGRAWVSTSSTYPHIKPGQEPNDKIIILEDVDGDGVADKSTIFAEGLFVPHSVMPVKGGAYVAASTELLFLADTNGDDIADEQRVVYSGFGNADVHHMIHGLRWAPWGDLYFTQSIYINSFIDTPFGNRRLNGSGIWAFRPETEQLEVFSRGMVNPWGHAFDDWGQAFATDGAGGKGPHYVFPGIAHQTAVGAERVLDGLIPGKPKNTAAEFISGRHFPPQWTGDLISNDFRLNRTVRYRLEEDGSGYKAKELKTVLHSSHRSYRPVDTKMGPDGAMYIVDWYNPIIDHGEVDFHHPSRDRSHGRIWRMTAKNRSLVKPPKIYGASVNSLLELLKSPEDYTRMQANRELVNRNCAPETLSQWAKRLNRLAPRFEHNRLEALWLSFALNSPDESLLRATLASKDHHARAAAVRMLARLDDQQMKQDILAKMVLDKAPQVRLEAVNALRTLGSLKAVELALQALDQPLDENLDYAIWLTANSLKDKWLPLAESGQKLFDGKDSQLAYALIAANNKAAIPLLLPLVKSGNLTEETEEKALLLIARLGDESQLSLVLARALADSNHVLLQGLANAPASNEAIPSNTAKLGGLLGSKKASFRKSATQLIGRWKVQDQKESLYKLLMNEEVFQNERLAVADALIRIGDSTRIQELAIENDQWSVRAISTTAWAKSNKEGAIDNTIALLGEMPTTEFASSLFRAYIRSEKGPEILSKALEEKTLPSEIAIVGNQAAQSAGRDLSELVEALNKAGDLQSIGLELDEKERVELLQAVVEDGSVARGRRIYERESLLCTSCHRVDGKGGKLGPDLTSVGGYMTPSSILESVLNPNTDIKQGYETINIIQKDGTIISGTLYRKTQNALLVRDPDGAIITVPNSNIAKQETIPISLMPKGLTASLRQDELVDLMRYLTDLGSNPVQ